MKLLYILLLSFFLKPYQETVLVCRGPSAYAYHSRKCSGVQNCSREIERVTLAEAVRLRRTPCETCYAPKPLLKGVAASDAQCKATTQKGSRCSRKAKGSGYCWQHE